METKYFFIFLFFFPKIFFSQTNNDKTIYLDSLWKETSKDNYKYQRIVKDYYLDKPEYRFEDYYSLGVLQMEGNSVAKDNLSPNGDFTYYYENGNKKTVCSYEKGRPNGNTSEWYENGAKKLEGQYIQNPDEYSYEIKINQYWDSNGIQTVIDGNGDFERKIDNSTETGKIKNGWKEGVWKGKNDYFKLIYTELYENGKLISGTSIDSLQEEHKYDKVFLQPRPKKGLDHFYKYIGKKFRIPKSAEGVSGKIILQFEIQKDGSIDKNVKVIKSLGYGLDEESIRLISEYPDWGVGEFRGVKVKTSYSLPITIKL